VTTNVDSYTVSLLSVDDLLMCNCTTLPLDVRYGLAEAEKKDQGSVDGDEDSDDEGPRGFVPATLADPAPVSAYLHLDRVLTKDLKDA
jgi:hypothetical protein